MSKYAFYFNAKRCTGCKTCMLACKDYNDLSDDFSYRKIFEYGGGECSYNSDGTVSNSVFVYYVSLACNHCVEPACMHVCPTKAMHKDENELVSVDVTRCVGCGYCAMACPYDAPKVDREKGHSVKCDGCTDRVSEGKKPICVEACPLRALDFGEIDEIKEKYPYAIQANFAPLPEATYTDPNLLVIEPVNREAPLSKDGHIINYLEVM